MNGVVVYWNIRRDLKEPGQDIALRDKPIRRSQQAYHLSAAISYTPQVPGRLPRYFAFARFTAFQYMLTPLSGKATP
jgi:hypothetical protein